MNGIYDEIASLQTRQHQEAQAHKGQLPRERQDWYRREASKLTLKQSELTDNTNRARNYDPKAAEQANRMSQLRARYPDVMSDPRYIAYADGAMKMLEAQDHPVGWETADAAIEQTRRQFKLGPYRNGPAVDRHTRERLSGLPRGAGGEAGEKRTFKMTKQDKVLAEALYDADEPAVAHKKWMKTVGSKLSR